MRDKVREKQGREAHGTFLIVDAQSVKNSDTAGHKGHDASKKVSGIKRHIAVDTQGLAACHCRHDGQCHRSQRRVGSAGARQEKSQVRQELAKTLDRGTQLCLAGEMQKVVEKRQAQAQLQFAVCLFGFLGFAD